MLIGKPGPATTSICTSDASSIEIRGRDLCGDLMGRMSFTSFFYLLVTGREPTEQQAFFLDLLLVAIAEHGLTPTAQASRMTYDADPACLQAAVAAGILGCGTVVLGTSELCGQVLVDARNRMKAGGSAAGRGQRHRCRDSRAQRQDAGLRSSHPSSGRSAHAAHSRTCGSARGGRRICERWRARFRQRWRRHGASRCR